MQGPKKKRGKGSGKGQLTQATAQAAINQFAMANLIPTPWVRVACSDVHPEKARDERTNVSMNERQKDAVAAEWESKTQTFVSSFLASTRTRQNPI
jgi:hypothetical protein